eukprot:TRINITY_DN48122_c0_g1_i1.p1 TRINITY_DN48122_c0_g1~~TRINITY_DN48122_c0_g1_i1.p1  ORF type:complete len:285 (-),score=51.26 TRINITY_DN48122_c0_g1_i1:26-880(-)
MAPLLMILSPAKTLNMSPEKGVKSPKPTVPNMAAHTKELIARAKMLSKAEIKKLMALSEELAKLNYDRFQTFEKQETKEACLAFDGPAFRGLDASTLTADEASFSQSHLRILSGLYGVLLPYDLIRPYRLEMGRKLDNNRAKDLYGFWGEHISNQLLKALAAAGKGKSGDGIVVNCASQEYFKAVNLKVLRDAGVKVVTVDFPGPAVYAKKARGMMCRHIIKTRVTTVEGLKSFVGDQVDVYSFDAKASKDDKLVFNRKTCVGGGQKRKAGEAIGRKAKAMKSA